MHPKLWQHFAPAAREKSTRPVWPVASPSSRVITTRFHCNGGKRRKKKGERSSSFVYEAAVVPVRDGGKVERADDGRCGMRQRSRREINTDRESEAVEIPLTDLWVSRWRWRRGLRLQRSRPRVPWLTSDWLRVQKATQDERVSLVASTPTAAKVRDTAPCFISADENVPICIFLSFANDEFLRNGCIACSVQTQLGSKPDTHTTHRNLSESVAWKKGKRKKQIPTCTEAKAVHLRDDCSCTSFVAAPVDCICFTVAFSGRMAPWIIYATNELSCRCRCSAEDNQGTRYCRRSHRARLVVEQKSNMWKWN